MLTTAMLYLCEKGPKLERSRARIDRFIANVERIEKLNTETICVRLSCPAITHYKAGQYLQVFVNEQTVRSYSLASSPGIDEELHLHIRKSASGGVSRWFHEELAVGDAIHIGPPQGSCFYLPVDIDQPILMIGTGSGLAPLYSMARNALRHGHRSQINLYHGVRHRQELYLVEQLHALSRVNKNFQYFPCVSRGLAKENPAGEGSLAGRALDIALRDTSLSEDWRIYLSGNPAMVHDAREAIASAGVPLSSIFSDLFVSSSALSCAA